MSSYYPPIESEPLFNSLLYEQANNPLSAYSLMRFALKNAVNIFSNNNTFLLQLNLPNGFNVSTLAYVDNNGNGYFQNIYVNNQNVNTIYAPINSPIFTGIPQAPTPILNTNTNQIATCLYVYQAIQALVNGAPVNLSLLNELGNAINNDPQFGTDVLNYIATKQNIINASNLLNAAYIGNGDITNTILSYLKNVTSDIQGQFNSIDTILTGVTYTNNSNTFTYPITISKSSLYITDNSNSTPYFGNIYYYSNSLIISNAAGYNNLNATMNFRFYTPSGSYVDSLIINNAGLTSNIISNSVTVNANGNLYLLGNLNVNSTIITPTNLSFLNNLTQNIQTFINNTINQLNAIANTLTNISYNSIINTTFISGYTAFYESTINNNLSVGSTIACNNVVTNNIVNNGNLQTTNININGTATLNGRQITYVPIVWLYIANMTIPIMKSIKNIASYNGLNLLTLIINASNTFTYMMNANSQIIFYDTSNNQISNVSNTTSYFAYNTYSSTKTIYQIQIIQNGLIL